MSQEFCQHSQVILVCRFDEDDNAKGNSACSDQVMTLLDLSKDGEDSWNSEDSDEYEQRQGKKIQPYMVFCMQERPKIVQANPGMPFGAIWQALASAWGKLSNAEKAQYVTTVCSAGLPLVQRVMQHLGLTGKFPGRDPTPTHFLAFLLSICYNVGTSRDFEPEDNWNGDAEEDSDSELGNFEVKQEIAFLCPDQVERRRLALVLAFLAGHHKRLGQASKVSFLPDNWLVLDWESSPLH